MSESGLPKRKPGRPRKMQLVSAVDPGGIMPLDYMLAVLRDETAGTTRRDRMAIAAAPYCHQRIIDAAKGKKELAEQKAADVDSDLVAELEQEAANNAVH